MIKKLLIATCLVFTLFTLYSNKVWAQENLEGKVTKILEEKEVEIMGSKQPFQRLEILITKGSLKDQKLIIENGNLPLANVVKYKTNDRVNINREQGLDGNDIFDITDFIRRDSLLLLFIIFVVVTIVVGKWRGFSSVVSLTLTFLVIFYFILPQISQGTSPILITIIGSIIIIPITFYVSHGFNKKTTVAVVSTLFGMVFIGVMSTLFIGLSKLTGLSSEEAGMLLSLKNGDFNMQGILLAGIMIGALGVLDDITISQASIVEQLREALPVASISEIYKRASKIGQDHITSVVNTLILVYAGASMPLLLMFVDNPHPFSEIINYEFIAEEIVRTLVGSVGLILTVPLTTLIACLSFQKNNEKNK
ncbi:MAG: YibE/F family protein [Candidatus Shapirobacteria bacterium]|nr:YibE/F family protein [Candidatus Shapirobacteria bacterium]